MATPRDSPLDGGTIDHCAGTRDVTQLSGLVAQTPMVGLVAVLAGLSMAKWLPGEGSGLRSVVEATVWGSACRDGRTAGWSASLSSSDWLRFDRSSGGSHGWPGWLTEQHWRLVVPWLVLGIVGLAISFGQSQSSICRLTPQDQALYACCGRDAWLPPRRAPR